MAAADIDWDPKPHFEMQDISLWETSLKRFLEYQPGVHEGNLTVLSRRTVQAELIEASDAKGESAEFLRGLVTLGTRAVYVPAGDVRDAAVSSDDVALFELEATFAVTYTVKSMPTQQKLEDFINWHCVHNAWPFWRQHVYDTLKRASLPLISIPFFSGRPKGALPPDRVSRKPSKSSKSQK